MITKQTYELSFLALPDLSETDVQSMQTELAEVITKAGGEVASPSDVHFIDLEYTMIKKVKSSNVRYDQAYFAWQHFAIEPSVIDSIDQHVGAQDNVLRHLVVKTLADETVTNVFTRGEEEEESTVNNDQSENEAKEGTEEKTTSVASDDLTKIEGIGPKIAETLTNEGIGTYVELADADVDELRSILTDAGLGNHDPATWSQQSALARDGKWEELTEWQDQLDGGKA